MFTDRAQQLLDGAKSVANMQGAGSVTIDALLLSVRRHAEARVLLTRCTGLTREQLLDEDGRLEP